MLASASPFHCVPSPGLFLHMGIGLDFKRTLNGEEGSAGNKKCD